MKILITGSAGFVGKNLFSSLNKNYEVYGISRRASTTTTHQADITSLKIFEILDIINPNIIMHCAALSNVDFCEEHRAEAIMTNIIGTHNIVSWAAMHHAKIIYISSDYVYAGETDGYNEESETKPVNFYGEIKLISEKLVSEISGSVILRPTVVFGYDIGGNNFLMQMLSLKEKRKIPRDQWSNPTDVRILCDYVREAIIKNIEGTYVATGPETLDRYSFALLIADVFGINKELLQPVVTETLHQKAKRPLHNGTDSSRIRSLISYSCPSVRTSLEDIKKKLS